MTERDVYEEIRMANSSAPNGWEWTNVVDLVPGDRFVARGRVDTVAGPPEDLSGLGLVTIPVQGQPDEREFVAGRLVPAWRQT